MVPFSSTVCVCVCGGGECVGGCLKIIEDQVKLEKLAVLCLGVCTREVDWSVGRLRKATMVAVA